MKILPPVKEWLPGLVRSRTGRLALLAACATVGSLTLVVAGLPRAGGGMSAARAPAVACSALVLDRSVHVTRAESCPDEAMSGDTGRIADGAIERADMAPRAHRLTDDDRAIEPPETLRASVHDIDIARSPPLEARSLEPQSLAAPTDGGARSQPPLRPERR